MFFDIKIEDLFNKLNFTMNPTPDFPEISWKSNIDIKIKTPTGYSKINEFVKKCCTSYKILFNNKTELICSDKHILCTSNGQKEIRNIKKNEEIYGLNNDKIWTIKIENIEIYKENDILYDVCIDHPHLYLDSNGLIHHNSLILAYIYKTLFENNLVNKQIVVVPNLNLITQFKNDWIDYGIPKEKLGEVWANSKEWDKDVVISTWQSLSKASEKYLNMFDSVFLDECHTSRSTVVKETLSKMENAEWRIGCTGTLPDSEIDDLNIRSYLGPVIIDYSTKKLKKAGYLAPCEIHQINLHYNKEYKGQFNDVKDEIFKNDFRLNVIKNELSKLNDWNVLLLVNKVEDEGQFLLDYLLLFDKFKDCEFVFLSGKNKKDEREYWRQECNKNERKIRLISTYPILQAGTNIPSLSKVFFVSPSKSKIRVLQSIGRTLRLFERKDKAEIYDFIDHNNKWFVDHSEVRELNYLREDFEINSIDYYEKDHQIDDIFKS